MTQQLLANQTESKRARITYARFLKDFGESAHVEWVNGEAVLMAPISDEHQHVGAFLVMILNGFVTSGDLGFVMYEPFQMKTGPGLPGRAPDICFISKKSAARMKKTHIE